MSDDLYQRLSEPFAVSEHATVNKGGSDQTYVPWTEYVERINHVLGINNWSFRVIREGFTATECWVLGEIRATIDGVEIVRQQYGCEPITKGRDAKPTTDLLKSSASDAIKKAASLLGVGLYLSVKEERAAIQKAMRAEVQAAAKAEADARRNGGKTASPAKQEPQATDAPLAPVTPIRGGATTPPAGAASPSSSTTATAASGGTDKPLKTKAQLVDDMNRGIAMARSLGLDPADPDPAAMNRADLENTIKELARQIKIVKAAKAEAAS